MEYWIWMQNALGPGSVKAAKLVRALGGIDAVFASGERELRMTEFLAPRDISRLLDKSLEKSKQTVGTCMEKGYDILTPDDEKYPGRLREIYAPPCVLYIWGEVPDVDTSVYIAVVGTRRITEYGYEAATRLSMGLAGSGVVVVSGLAVGADAAAHKGALKAGGKTVAVVGSGIDYDYPVPNRELKRLISKNGAVVSEYPPGMRPDSFTFPLRNRIIAGLSLGTLVVEAGSRSGSLITAGLAAEMGRDVFAVPGSIFSPMSEGTNRLIRDGAKPVCGTLDILEEYIDLYGQSLKPENKNLTEIDIEVDNSEKIINNVENSTQKRTPPGQGPSPRKAPCGLSEAQMKVYSLLSSEPVHVDELSLRANMELKVVLAVLTTLEVQGLVRSYPGRKYIAVQP